MFDSAPSRVAGTNEPSAYEEKAKSWMPLALAVVAAFVFYLSTKATQPHFDYTYRIAGALLNGHLGLLHQPPSWLNEMIPLGGEYYSVFPLGAVLAVVPCRAPAQNRASPRISGPRSGRCHRGGVCLLFLPIVRHRT